MLKWIATIVFLSCCGYAVADQYRSKLLINPNQSLGESVELSVDELESQFDEIQDQFARSSAGQHLAHHYVQKQQYDKAVGYYQQALSANGLSEIVNHQMLQELATVYLWVKQPAKALSTLERIAPLSEVKQVEVALLYAKAALKNKQHLLSAKALDKTLALNHYPTPSLYQQVLAISWEIGQYERSEYALKQLMKLNELEPSYWFQLATVYLKQNKQQQALSVLILAESRGFVFSEQSILLFADLYGSLDAPYKAAQVMKGALKSGRLSEKGEYYRRLFEFQLRAQEHEGAIHSLSKAAEATGEVELYFYWAQLLMEKEQWQQMNQVMLNACTRALTVQNVGQANVLLGISELKLGKAKLARSSFLNASLVGGANEQAGQWLRYMGEVTTGVLSKKHLSGPCKVNS